MNEKMDGVAVVENGIDEQTAGFVDNRLQLIVDPKRIETWELMVMENAKINDWLLIFCRYLYRGETAVSPHLPNKPLDELTPAELKMIKESDAYKLMKRFKLPALRGAAQSFVQQANAGF